MTPKKFLLLLFAQWLILALLKAWFFNSQIFGNPGLQQIVYWLLTAAIVAAMVRRFGHISFFEAFFLVFSWTLFDLLFDLLLLSPYTGVSIFSGMEYWWGIVILVASIMLFHKKRHIKIRNDLRAHH
jgi:hypothetical protein